MTKPTGRPRGRPRKQPPSDDFDDLIGASEPPKRGPGRPPKPKPEKKPPPAVETPYLGDGAPLAPPPMDLAEVYGGVSATWLAQVFGADKNTIKKKLAKADDAILKTSKTGTPLYSLPHIVPYLVKPKVDLVAWIKSLRPNDLPAIVQDAYWAAMIKRQKWEENAKDLWRTEDVISVFGDVFMMVKTTAQLWIEEVDRHHGLTPDQRKTLTQLVDNLLEGIYEQLIELPGKRRTTSSVAEEGVIPDEGHKPPSPEGVDVV